MKILLSAVATAVVAALAAPAGIAAAAPVAASWQKHDFSFNYMGFTTHYSCDGLDEKLRLLLRRAGARPDVKIRSLCTAPMGGPQRITTAELTFYTLRPAGAGAAVAAGKQTGTSAVSGAWKTVKFRAGAPWEIGGGDCELVEQFAHDILPMFTTRAVDNQMTCVPHQVNALGIDLQFEVLAPLPQADRHPA